mmetsp:Transcript_3913/g.4640  ORF Transcript_3913/g.4640 Transcript_3913/m.4640 type:complete len:96 (-) Transcript_3913:67-354(-)
MSLSQWFNECLDDNLIDQALIEQSNMQIDELLSEMGMLRTLMFTICMMLALGIILSIFALIVEAVRSLCCAHSTDSDSDYVNADSQKVDEPNKMD